jgi:hypothetical protein
MFFTVPLSSGYGQKPEELLNNMRSLSPIDMPIKKYHKKILTFCDAPSLRIIENYMLYSAKLIGMNHEQYYQFLYQYKKLLSGFSFDVFTAIVSNSALNKCGYSNYMGKRWNKLNKLGKDKKVSEIKLLLVLSSAHHMVTKDITDACQKYKKVMPSTEFINFLNNF